MFDFALANRQPFFSLKFSSSQIFDSCGSLSTPAVAKACHRIISCMCDSVRVCACACACACVHVHCRALVVQQIHNKFNRWSLSIKGKRLELSTPKLIQMQSMTVASRAKKMSSKGQRSMSHGYEKVTVAGRLWRVLLLPAWHCTSTRLYKFLVYFYVHF